MDPALLSASAAVLGSLSGGLGSIATAWLTLRTQGRRKSIRAETRKRERLYSEFIAECSKLALDSIEHSLDRPDTLLQAYSLVNRIRLISSDAVLQAAEAAIKQIVNGYRAPNVPIEQLLDMPSLQASRDPLKAFSEACRYELKLLLQAWT